MSSESPSKNNRINKFARPFKGNLSSPQSHLSRPPDTPSDSSYDNHTATTDTGTSNLPHKMVPVVSVDRPPATAIQATTESILAVPSQLPSASIQGSETPPTHMPPNTHTPMSLFQGARNVYMVQPKITMANNVQNVSTADGRERTRLQILTALRDNLLPRAEFAEYDAASPAPRNACMKNTRKATLETLQVWASDNTATKVYWLNGMAGTGKTTIAYSFSEILDERNSLGATFFSSRLRADTSDVRCIIPTICLQLAKHFPLLSQLILDVVETNPDCKSWRISKQFLNFIIKPLTTAYRGAREVVVVPVIVLDALDECSDQSLATELLSMIFKHNASLPVKFFITSHPEIRLKGSFHNSWAHSNFILHEVEKEIVKVDVDRYIKACWLDGISINNGNFNSFQDPPSFVLEDFSCSAGWRIEKHIHFMADIRGLGRADVVGFGDAGVLVSLNNGGGSFSPVKLALNNFGYVYVGGGWRLKKHLRCLADVTGNKLPDIVGFGEKGVIIANNKGDGTFQAARCVLEDFCYNTGWRIEEHPRFLADLTGDGRADIIGFGVAGVYVSLNNGSGTFGPVKRVIDDFAYNAGGWRAEKHPRFIADLTGNKRGDVIGFADGGVCISMNNGDGTFGPVKRVLDNFGYIAGGWRVEEHLRFVVDLTGNGCADIIGFGENSVFVSYNDGKGNFGPVQRLINNFTYKEGWTKDDIVRWMTNLYALNPPSCMKKESTSY